MSPPTDAPMQPPPMDRTAPTDPEATVVALGCFWGVEAAFGALDGVVRTTVGFAGGQSSAPTYAAVRDHAEAVAQDERAARVEIVGDGEFCAAALRHQKHLLRRHDDVTAALRARLPDERALARSPAATLATGYLGGHRHPSRLADDRARLGLPADALSTLRAAAQRHGNWNTFVQAERCT